MEVTDPTQQIEETYIDSVLNGDKVVTITSADTPNGVFSTKTIKRSVSAKNCLEYLRTAKPEKWSPPPAVQQVQIKQETINNGIEELQKLITFVPND
jgi:hypothetical protein